MKEILKGIVIGIGKIIPGVSGSVLAISLGVYEQAINSFNNIFKESRNIYFLLKLSIGILISIIFVSRIIVYFLNNHYSYTIFLFIGLILGSLDEVTKNVRFKHWYYSLLSFIIISFMGCFNLSSSFNSGLVTNLTYFFISGIIESMSAIIPGISGTALLMLLGSYDKIMVIFSNILNISFVFSNLNIIIPFLIGILLGLFISIKLISFLFKKYYYQTYSFILGLLFGSVFIMIKSCSINFLSGIIGILISCLSYLFMKKVNHFF